MKKLIEFLEKKKHPGLEPIKNGIMPHLHLSNLNLGDKGVEEIVEVLKDNNFIIFLSLFNNKIGNEGAKALRKLLTENSTINNIWLEINEIGNEGAKEIAEGLKRNNTITNFNISYNKITLEGERALAQVLETNNKILYLCTDFNYISDQEWKKLESYLERNRKLAKENDEKATQLSIQGNEFFEQEEYDKAIQKYQEAININNIKKPLYLTNKMNAEKYKNFKLQHKEDDYMKSVEQFHKMIIKITTDIHFKHNNEFFIYDEMRQLNKAINKIYDLSNKAELEKILNVMQGIISVTYNRGRIGGEIEENINKVIEQRTKENKEITYDQSFLNHPVLLLNTASDKFSDQEIAELSLSPGLNYNEDVELIILSDLMSLGDISIPPAG